MVAFLEKSTGSAGFHQIIDFLNRSHICYALTKKPEVCVSFIKQFWRSAEASTDDNGEVKINATIDGHSLSITEGSLRRHLKLADQDGITSIPNSEIFEQLALMGYHTDSDKLTFQKGAFSPQWRFLIHNILHCLSPKRTVGRRVNKKLEARVKIGKARRQARVVLSDDEDLEDDSSHPGDELSDAEAQEKDNNAGGSVTYIRRSAEKRLRQDKGKAIMIESEPKKKSKKELEQERLSNLEKVWDFNQNIEPMDAEHGSEKEKSPEKSTEKIVEEDVDTQEEMKEVVVEELYRLVKNRYSASRPEGFDLMLWGDLHTLFEPDEDDEIWKDQHEYNLLSWRLYDFSGIHILLMENGLAIHMLTEKKYPLSQEMISKMLKKKLEVDHESSQAIELLRFIRSQVQK
ncbi:hypothetical protein Tco_0052641 [Tanacetum coccineum]